ncbi:MAG: fused MFS/spermidine synthase [Planctomycetota bacterium]
MTLLAAGLAGFAVLAVEILGVHLLAPWFGTSALVWSQQIGLVLAAIALGGWLGGRLATRSRAPMRAAAICLFIGGVLLSSGIFLLEPFAQTLLPDGLTLDEAAAIFSRGAFTAAMLFFVPPVLLLSMLSPLLVQIRSAECSAGKAAGDVSAAGTLGSLLGVFFSTFYAIPVLGVRLTLVLTCVALLLAGALLWNRKGLSVAAALPLALLLIPDPAAGANLPTGAVVKAVANSSYQHLRVIEFPGGERWLQMNEGLDSFQSIWREGQTWPGGYYDLFALAPIYAHAGLEREASSSIKTWVLGFGAGSAMEPLLFGASPNRLDAVGVELDPAVVKLGQEWMPMRENTAVQVRVVAGADARSLLRVAKQNLDLVLLDAYARQFEIPLHLATQEFFAEVYSHLRPGGVLALNLGTTASIDAEIGFVDRIRKGLELSFGDNIRMHRVPKSRNWVVFARREMPFPSLEELVQLLPEGLPLELGAACLPGQTRNGGVLKQGVEPFSDDLNPLQIQQTLEWWREAP